MRNDKKTPSASQVSVIFKASISLRYMSLIFYHELENEFFKLKESN